MITSIRGLQETQRDNLRRIAAMKGTPFQNAIRIGTLAAHRYAVALTHVDTGTLRSAHMMRMERVFLGGPRGRVFINPSAPGVRRSNGRRRMTMAAARPSVYGVFEHARGGEHAFYERVEREYGATIAKRSMASIAAELKL